MAAALSGFVAKEQIVSTMGVLVNVADDSGMDPALWQAVMVMFPLAMSAVSFLMFNLPDAPCLAAISTLAKEMNSRAWIWFAIGWQMFYAWTIALIVYKVGIWMSTGQFGFWTIAALILIVCYLWMIVRRPHDSCRKPAAVQAA